jgi:hypothetical protein
LRGWLDYFGVMKLFVFFAAFSLHLPLLAQRVSERWVDLSLAGGSNQGSAAVFYLHNWRFGHNHKFEFGLGARFTGYLAANQYYTTAPAKLTSGSTGPGVIFVDNINANVDTLLVAQPRVFSLNAMINLGYHLSEKFSINFNIDVVGFSFGSRATGNYINGFLGQLTMADPTPFNALLISDNDLGTLNSELSGKYKINNKWSVKAGAQFLFTEYTTIAKVQQAPEPNDRFRNKSLMVMAGISYKL